MQTTKEKPTSEHTDSVHSSRAIRAIDADELVALIDLLREGDDVRVNERRQAITVVRLSDRRDHRSVRLEGNGTVYTLMLDRETGAIRLQVGTSGEERLEDLRVEGRNPLNISEYDRLLDEELETTATNHYVNRMRDIEGGNPGVNLSPRVRWGEWEFEDGEVCVLQWAASRYLDAVAEGYFSGGTEYQHNLWDDARTLWERLRRRDDRFTAFGDEIGKVGAVLDYAVEDTDIHLPERVHDEIDRLRNGDCVEGNMPESPWPVTVPRP